MKKQRDIVRYQGYAARRRAHAYNDMYMAGAVIGLGGLFLILAYAFSIAKAVVGVFAVLAMLTAFLNREMVIYVMILALSFPIPVNVGPITLMTPDFAIFLLFFTMLMRLASDRKLIMPPGLYVIPALVFVLSMIMSSLASANITVSMPEIVQIVYYVMIIPFIILNIAQDTASVNKYLKVHALSLVAQSVLIILQNQLALRGNFLFSDIFSYANRGGYTIRSFGSIGPAVGMHLGLACAVLMSWAFSERNPAAKLLLGGGVMLVFYANLCTGTRSTSSFLAVVIVLLFLYRRRYIVFIASAFVFLVGILFVIKYGPTTYPFSLFFHGEAFRYMDIDMAMKAFYQSPVLGVGAKQFMRRRGFEEVPGVENEFVAQLAAGGVIGAAAFLLLLGAVIYLIILSIRFRDRLSYETAGMLLFSFAVFVMAAFTVASIFFGGHGHVFVLIIGYVLAMYHSERRGGHAAAYANAPPAPDS